MMNLPAGIPRSRGALCGVLLILLGLWGGLAPFVGPYFHFGYTPDKTWFYSTARLYFSIAPAAAAVLGGVLVLLTRSRAIGVLGGLLAALGGLWFSFGNGFTVIVLQNTTLRNGAPISTGLPAGSVVLFRRSYLESVALFGGLGALILFVGALAVGRFSLAAAKDMQADSDDDAYYPGLPAVTQPGRPASAATPFPSGPDQYASTDQFSQPPSSPPSDVFPDLPTRFPGQSPPLSDAPTQAPPPESAS